MDSINKSTSSIKMPSWSPYPNQRKSLRLRASVSDRSIKKKILLISCLLYFIVLFVPLVASVMSPFIGMACWKKCPGFSSLPTLLLVLGPLSCLEMGALYIFITKNLRSDWRFRKGIEKIVILVTKLSYCGLVLWVTTVSVKLYGLPVTYDEEDKEKYCDPTCYRFAVGFALTTISLFGLVAFLFIFGCLTLFLLIIVFGCIKD